jgi:uncharacterized membrane protein
MAIFSRHDSHYYGKKLFSTRRIESMTDGVFAIAMTLLVLDLDVSSLGNISSDQQLWQSLVNILGDNFISFIISFLLLGSMWAIHVRQFEHIKYVDRHMITINTLRLLTVVLIPFTTSLSGDYPKFLIANILFPINFLLLAIVSAWQWNYATSNKHFYDTKELTQKNIMHSKDRNLAFIIISLAVTVVAVFIGSWAFMLFFAIPYLSIFLTGHLKEKTS